MNTMLVSGRLSINEQILYTLKELFKSNIERYE